MGLYDYDDNDKRIHATPPFSFTKVYIQDGIESQGQKALRESVNTMQDTNPVNQIHIQEETIHIKTQRPDLPKNPHPS